eukprot:scaffold25842_cov198-Amphora_coffeaeformis.AAC.38
MSNSNSNSNSNNNGNSKSDPSTSFASQDSIVIPSAIELFENSFDRSANGASVGASPRTVTRRSESDYMASPRRSTPVFSARELASIIDEVLHIIGEDILGDQGLQ